MAKSNALKLTTKALTRRPIELDNERYEMRNLNELDAREGAILRSRLEKVDTLEKKGDTMSDSDAEKLTDLLTAMVAEYTTIPKDVVETLPYNMRAQVIKLFTETGTLLV